MDQEDERAPRRDGEQEGISASGAEARPTGANPPPGRPAAGGTGGSSARGTGGGGGALAVGGFEFAAVILASVFLGQWLDRRLGTAPVFLLVCVFVGFAGATFSMYRRLTAAQAREDAERRARNGTSKQ